MSAAGLHMLRFLGVLACGLLVVGEEGTRAQEDASSIFAVNPVREDRALELQRLRLEGVAQYEAGLSLEDATARFRSAFELSGAANDAFNVALVAFRQNDLAEMRVWLDRALAVNPGHPNANYLLGVAAKQDGDFAAAREYWRKTVESYPQDAQLHYQIALVERSLGDESASLQSFIHALGLDPDHPGALYQMARIYRMDGNAEAAKSTMDRFTGVKKRERFSRREAAKEPSALTRPIHWTPEATRSVFLDRTLSFETRGIETECDGVWVGALAEVEDDTVRETALVACADGRVVHVNVAAGTRSSLGSLPDGALDLMTGSPDDQGTRLLLRREGRLMVSSPVGAGPLDFVEAGDAPAAMRPVDIDSDGDLDLVFLDGSQPLVNAGDLTFVSQPEVYGDSPLLPALEGALDARAVDMRRNGMADFAVLDAQGVTLVAGDVLGFVLAWSVAAEYAEGSRLSLADIDANGEMDILVHGPHGLDLYRNAGLAGPGEGGERVIETAVAGLVVADVNNDSLFDLITLGDEMEVRLNMADGAFAAPQVLGAEGAGVLVADLTGDGNLDLAVPQDGRLALLANTTELPHAVRFALQGIRSVPSGLMSQVEVRSGAHYAYLQGEAPVLHVGLGENPYAEVIRIEWTNGFVENKLNVQASEGPFLFVESERISGSCPSVFVWDGEKFQYLSDAFISGPMGVPIDRGVYFPISDRETMVIDDGVMRLRDGTLDIRFTEELLETVYLDRAELVAVDHPAGSLVTAHSRLAAPPAGGEFYVARAALPIVNAVSSTGFDVTAELAARDAIYAEVAEMDRQNIGFAKAHWIEFELPEGVEPGEVDALLARGWFYYFDSTSMISQSQRDKGRIGFPMLEQFVDGAWVPVGPIGVPAGKDKVSVMPLGGQLSSRKLRLSSAIAVYWDTLSVSISDATQEVELSVLPMVEADLRFRGLSKMTQRNPELFDYHSIRYATFWNPMIGAYSGYGGVEEMVAAEDGIYAIFGTGDEIAFRFEAPAAPPAEGMDRSYLLRFVGYVKDGDRYTSDGNRVDPVPFLGMMSYPAVPPDGYVYPESGMRRTRQPFDYTLQVASKDHRT